MQPLEINQLVLSDGEPCIITKITAKTVFIKPCRTLVEHCFNMNIMWETYDSRVILSSYLPEPSLHSYDHEKKILKKNFMLKCIPVGEVLNRIYKDGHLIEPTILEHEAFINTDRYKLKCYIMTSILFFKSELEMLYVRSRREKYEHLLKFLEEFRENEDEYTRMMHEITNEFGANEINYYDMWITSSSPERLEFLRS